MRDAVKGRAMPRMLDVVLFGIYAIASVASMVVIKRWAPVLYSEWAEAGAPQPSSIAWILLGVALYGGSFGTWMVILSRNDISVAFPVALGLTLGISTAIAALFLGEVLTASRAIGIVLILIAIILIV